MYKITIRFLLLFIAVAIAFGVQLLSFSTLIDGKVNSDQNFLKNHINYFVSICGIAFSILAYVLGGYFTRDIVWHLKEKPGNKRFNKAWGFAPDLPSVLQGIHIGGLRWIIVGVALSLLAAFSIVRGVWLTLSIKINPHVTYSPPRNISVATIHGDTPEAFGRTEYLATHLEGSVMGLKGSTVLHRDDDGEYIWSPWLIDDSATEVIIEDYMTVGLRPKCTLLKGSQVNSTIVAGTITLSFNAALYNTSDSPSIDLAGNRRRALWAAGTASSTLDYSSYHEYYVSYHVFTTDTAYDPSKSYTFQSNEIAGQLNAYMYACKIDLNIYNISGIITSNPGPSLDRLTLWKKTLITTPPKSPVENIEETEGYKEPEEPVKILDKAGSAIHAISMTSLDMVDTSANEICIPLHCWMYDSIPGSNTGYNSRTDGPATRFIYDNGWVNMSAPLLEYKLAQLIGFAFSPTTLANNNTIMAQVITHDFITETIKPYIWVGVLAQLVLVLVVIGLYITAVSDFRDSHGADLNYLVSVIKKDNPLEDYSLKSELDSRGDLP
ncbi:hypothetical protein BGX27_006888 [Mortierella sp. AM989]|nr:hypothetical protein BGX27_006888 [Mortierella sp. AM989]